jgi:hypothetical protein
LKRYLIDPGKSWKDIPNYDEQEDEGICIENSLRKELEEEEKTGLTPEYVYDFLKKAYAEAEPNTDIIHFSWF